ncbi:MAG: hypothetical protein U0694_24895 [Anaerolineae bacterium]
MSRCFRRVYADGNPHGTSGRRTPHRCFPASLGGLDYIRQDQSAAERCRAGAHWRHYAGKRGGLSTRGRCGVRRGSVLLPSSFDGSGAGRNGADGNARGKLLAVVNTAL